MKIVLNKCLSPRGEIKVNGDKSITHRGLIISSIAEGQTLLRGYSKGNDCMSTRKNLKGLGIEIRESESTILIQGKGLGGLTEPEHVLDCENSGTTMRLLAGLLSGQDFFSVLTGDNSLRKRPMDRIIKPLQNMGAEIRARKKDMFAPLSIKGGNLTAINYKLPVASAQVKSAILFAGLYANGETTVEEPYPTRDHTERMLILFGSKIEKSGNKITLKEKNNLTPHKLSIPGDISSASYFIVLTSISQNGELFLKDVGINPTRTGILDILEMMGADISIMNKRDVSNEPIADILVKSGKLKGIDISGEIIPRIIDELPIIAVAATQAKGTTLVKNAAELRVKETDRIKAIVENLKKMGAQIEEQRDGFIVEGPKNLKGTLCNSYGDHRIAMSLAIAGLIADGATIIEGAEYIKISFPEFTTLLKMVCGEEYIRIEV
jgi:3-phosphoshikimate 1-carboxyvinyltransferase